MWSPCRQVHKHGRAAGQQLQQIGLGLTYLNYRHYKPFGHPVGAPEVLPLPTTRMQLGYLVFHSLYCDAESSEAYGHSNNIRGARCYFAGSGSGPLALGPAGGVSQVRARGETLSAGRAHPEEHCLPTNKATIMLLQCFVRALLHPCLLQQLLFTALLHNTACMTARCCLHAFILHGGISKSLLSSRYMRLVKTCCIARCPFGAHGPYMLRSDVGV